jgi:hypothetical protein
MKYLEELAGGDCFEYNSNYYILSKDFKTNGDMMCLGMFNGFSKWLGANSMVKPIELLTIDEDKNIIAIKKREKTNEFS